jgi:hypothetical protein
LIGVERKWVARGQNGANDPIAVISHHPVTASDSPAVCSARSADGAKPFDLVS